jgi:hypothetical protein
MPENCKCNAIKAIPMIPHSAINKITISQRILQTIEENPLHNAAAAAAADRQLKYEESERNGSETKRSKVQDESTQQQRRIRVTLCN